MCCYYAICSFFVTFYQTYETFVICHSIKIVFYDCIQIGMQYIAWRKCCRGIKTGVVFSIICICSLKFFVEPHRGAGMFCTDSVVSSFTQHKNNFFSEFVISDAVVMLTATFCYISFNVWYIGNVLYVCIQMDMHGFYCENLECCLRNKSTYLFITAKSICKVTVLYFCYRE